MFCGKCGKENVDGIKFCIHCGSDLSRLTPSPTDTLDRAATLEGTSGQPQYDTLDVAATQGAETTILAGQYRIVKKIGEGGMGVVYLAEDTEMRNRPVAIKVLPPLLANNRRAVENLRGEAITAIKLSHPNIVRLYGFHSDGDIKFLVMEYIDGVTLEEKIFSSPSKKLGIDETIKITEKIAKALDYAHSQKPPVIHRDLKLSNVMIDKNGSIKVLDFGIAREIHDSYTTITGKGDTSGTLPYMSPEQVRGQRPAPSMDIYSLGIICYECLNGKLPFHTGKIDYQIIHEKPALIEDVPDCTNNALQKVLAKEPDERPKTAAELVEDLRGHAVEKVVTKTEPQLEKVEEYAYEPLPPEVSLEKLRTFKTINWDRFTKKIKQRCDEIANRIKEQIGPFGTIECHNDSYSFHKNRGDITIAKLMPDDPKRPVVMAAFRSMKHAAKEYAREFDGRIDEIKVMEKPFIITKVPHNWSSDQISDVFSRFIQNPDKHIRPSEKKADTKNREDGRSSRPQTTGSRISQIPQSEASKMVALVELGSHKFYVDMNLVVLEHTSMSFEHVVKVKGLLGITESPLPGKILRRDDLSAAVGILSRLDQMDKLIMPDKPLLDEIDSIDVSNFDGRKKTRASHIVLYTNDKTEILWGAKIGNWQRYLEASDKEKLAKLYSYYKKHRSLMGNAKYIDLRAPQTSTPVQKEASISHGLVSYWSFNESKGKYCKDNSGNGHSGIVKGAKWVKGISGQALSFNGHGDYVDVADAARLNPTDAITITAWFKAESFALGSYSWPSLVSKYTDGVGGYDLSVQKIYEGTPQLTTSIFLEDLGPGGHITLQESLPTEVVLPNIWYFTAMTYDGSEFTLYRAKEGDAIPSAISKSGSGSLATSDSHLNIAECPYNPGRYWNGLIDEVRIYNRALTSAEIQSLYEMYKK